MTNSFLAKVSLPNMKFSAIIKHSTYDTNLVIETSLFQPIKKALWYNIKQSKSDGTNLPVENFRRVHDDKSRLRDVPPSYPCMKECLINHTSISL